MNPLDSPTRRRRSRAILVAVLLLCPALTQAGWYNNNWSNRKPITIQSSQVTANQSNFPVLISLASDAQLAGKARSDGFDILFTDDDGTTVLDHEVERYIPATGELIAWVRIPNLPSTVDKLIYLYYGYPSSPNQENPPGVWDGGYRGVWHLGDDSVTPTGVNESTSHTNHTSYQGGLSSSSPVSGAIGEAIRFDGFDDKLEDPSHDVVLTAGQDFTIEAWVRVANPELAQTVLTFDCCSPGAYLHSGEPAMYAYDPSDGNPNTWVDSNGTRTVEDGEWHHVVYRRIGGTLEVYDDGQFHGSGAYPGFASPSPSTLEIGAEDTDGDWNFDGDLDEVRISFVPRSPEWIGTEYANQSAPQDFYSLGPQETVISGTVFEDADFAGTASNQGGSDPGLPNVDVELYSAADAYLDSTTTDASGDFSFSVTDGTYKVRVRSATIGDDPGGPAETAPAGGFNACVPATCAEPLPEMTWGNGSAVYGGQDPSLDDTATGDNAGPGDTWLSITVSGAEVSGVNFGFAYNLIVNTADDALADSARSRQGSLRQFIKNANGIATAGGTTASASQFRVPAGLLDGNGVAAIATVAALPVVSDASGGTTIDGTTQTINVGNNNASGPEVQIDGAGAGSVDGLVILSAGNTVRGLIVNGFDQALRGGVKITGVSATGNTVAGSYIGTDHAGTASMPVRRGVIIEAGAQSNTIGGKTVPDRNVISGNNEFGVFLSGSGTDFNTIEGNFIGADAAGTSPLANLYGVYVTGGPQSNLIGGDTSDERNVISGNTLRGIILVGAGTDSNTISGNHIGIDVNGTAPVPNATGIQIVAAPQSTTIGGTLAGERNVVSGNTSTGIEIGNATLTEIRGNYIGTDVNGTAPLANGLGVSVLAGSTSNTIGGTDTADRNVISGNSLDGIWITGFGTSANTVLGNFIGTDSSGTNPLANGESGIEIKNSASGNTIGGTAAGSDNVISGNTLNGVAIFSSASGNFVFGNFIGTDPGGTLGVGNGTNGVLIFVDATSNTIGGTGPGEANVIGHNGDDGVYVDDAGTDNNSISGNSIFNNGGLGIDLDPDGVGTGTGSNDDKAAPTIVSIVEIASDFRAIATVGAGDTIEFFRVNNAAAPAVVADPSGSGEGFLFLGSCVDNGACSGPHVLVAADADAAAGTVQATLLATGISLGDEVAATATDIADNTSEFSSNAEALPPPRIVKRAFQLDGTPIAGGTTLPTGMPVRFILYIDNVGGAVADATLQDVLDPVFAYQTGSMKMDNTLLPSVVCPGGVCDEAAIFTQLDGSGIVLGDGDADADAGSYSAGTKTIDLGDGNNSNNAQLDLAADRVWAVVFTIRMQ